MECARRIMTSAGIHTPQTHSPQQRAHRPHYPTGNLIQFPRPISPATNPIIPQPENALPSAEKRPALNGKRPAHSRKHPAHSRKHPAHSRKRPAHSRKHYVLRANHYRHKRQACPTRPPQRLFPLFPSSVQSANRRPCPSAPLMATKKVGACGLHTPTPKFHYPLLHLLESNHI